MSRRLLDGRELAAKFAAENLKPQSREYRWKLIKVGQFPAPIKIGCRNFWIEEEIEAWKAQRIAAALAARALTSPAPIAA